MIRQPLEPRLAVDSQYQCQKKAQSGKAAFDPSRNVPRPETLSRTTSRSVLLRVLCGGQVMHQSFGRILLLLSLHGHGRLGSPCRYSRTAAVVDGPADLA